MFLEGLAELGVDKKLIRNKAVLKDLIVLEDQQTSDDNEEEEEEEEEEERTDKEEDTDEEGEERSEDESEHSSDEETDDETQEGKGGVDIAGCPKCLWHDAIPGGFKEGKRYRCPVCQNQFALSSAKRA